MLTIITSLKPTLSVKRKDLYPYSDTEAVRKAESVKVALSGMWQRSVCVSIVSSMDCESCFFCPFSTKEKFGANFQPFSFSASKAVPQQFFLLHEAKLFLPPHSTEHWSPPHHAYGHALSTVFIFATIASACSAASASLYMDTYLNKT